MNIDGESGILEISDIEEDGFILFIPGCGRFHIAERNEALRIYKEDEPFTYEWKGDGLGLKKLEV